jgi:flagellar biosynthetic protein FliR
MPAFVLAFGLLLARIGTFVAVMPLFGSGLVPRMVKVGLVVALAVAWGEVSFQTESVDELARQTVRVGWFGYTLALGREIALGALFGYAFGLFLLPARVAGEFLSEEMRLNFGGQLNPAGGTTGGPLSQVFESLGILVFFAVDGHHLVLAVLHGTFARFALGGSLPGVPVAHMVAGLDVAQEWGLLIAAPVALYLFASTLVLALLSRAAPQLNLYSVGFPAQIGVGLAAILLMLPTIVAGVTDAIGRCRELLPSLS